MRCFAQGQKYSGHDSQGFRLPGGTPAAVVDVVKVAFQLPMAGDWKGRP